MKKNIVAFVFSILRFTWNILCAVGVIAIIYHLIRLAYYLGSLMVIKS
jgi:hypothetical protein